MDRNQLSQSLQNNRINQLASSNKQPQMPSIGAMASNLARSVANNVQSVAAGNPLRLNDDAATQRLNICKGCEFFNSAEQRCTKCGCFMAVKTYLKAERCPVGKW
jgi:uncharacterized paraquat-inducible protein A